MLQQQTLQQNNQKEKLVQQNNHSNDDELNRIISFDVDLERVGEVEAVKKKVDLIIISPTIPFLEESEDEISEMEGKLFEVLSNLSA